MVLSLLCTCIVLTFPSQYGFGGVDAYYVPDVTPLTFQKGDDVPLKVNTLTSTKTQIPRDYYKLPFCAPENGPKMHIQNLGEFLTANKIQSSPYRLKMLTEVHCAKLCQVRLSKIQANDLSSHIKYEYRNNWIIDNLPSASLGYDRYGGILRRYAGGFPIGHISAETGTPYVYNHVNIEVDYHPYKGGYRVVAFAVEPLSVAHKYQWGYKWDVKSPVFLNQPLETCSTSKRLERGEIKEHQGVAPDEEILYTYDVMWRHSDVKWSNRWDVYLTEDNLVPPKVHWYSITNSIVVIVFLKILIARMIVKLRREIETCDTVDEETEDEKEEHGWRALHADVFRPPTSQPLLFCVFCGSGLQLGLTALCVILLSVVGFLSPAWRGSLMLACLVFYILTGVFAGYLSTVLYKAMDGKQWKLCALVTSLFVPGTTFAIFACLNVILFFQGAVISPLSSIVLVFFMWCVVSIPLVFVGAFKGYEANQLDFPTVTSTVSRAIPPPVTFYRRPAFGMVVLGVLPFATAYVALFFIMNSLWLNELYYSHMFGAFLTVYILMIAFCAEVTTLAVYYQLRAENHRWWWFSFCSSGSAALFTFLYSILYFRQLEACLPITFLLYFGYMFIISGSVFLILGSCGALSSLWFMRTIYGAIKVE